MRDKRRHRRTPVDRLSERIVASRPEARTPEPSSRRPTRFGTSTRILALIGVSACGGLGTSGLLPLAVGTDGGRALGGAQSEGGPAPRYNDDASVGLELSPPVAVDASSPADASADVHGDGAYVHPSDASAANPTDSATPCGELAQCCSRLILAPPLAAACYVTAQSDGGAAGCGSTLATFHDAGLCP